MKVAELMEEMKNRHADKLEKSHDKGWNLATNAYGNHIRKLKDHIYKSSYVYGLTSLAVSDNSNLFDKTILYPPDVLARFIPSSDKEKEDSEEGDGAAGGAGGQGGSNDGD